MQDKNGCRPCYLLSQGISLLLRTDSYWWFLWFFSPNPNLRNPQTLYHIMLHPFNLLETLLFSKLLYFTHRYLQGLCSFMLLSLPKFLTNPLRCHRFSIMLSSISNSLGVALSASPNPPGLLFAGRDGDRISPHPQDTHSSGLYLRHRTIGVTWLAQATSPHTESG